MFYFYCIKKWLIASLSILLITSYFSLFALTVNLDAFWAAVQRYGGTVGSSDQLDMEQRISSALGKTDEEKLTIINDYFQQIINYQVDDITWSEKDYWATPAETLAKRRGDCEDFAIAKYLFLLRVGIPSSKLRLIYVKAKIGGRRSRVTQAHMVLGYYKDGASSPLILDSLISEVLPAEQRTDLIPVFSFNSEGLWAAGQKKSAASPTARLSRWRNVLQKINDEGVSI